MRESELEVALLAFNKALARAALRGETVKLSVRTRPALADLAACSQVTATVTGGQGVAAG